MQLNDQQRAIVQTTGGRVAVVAGAGAGKTTTTMQLISSLHKERGIPLERMFISTFTNKEGRDLKSKLRKSLNIDNDKVEKLWIGTFHSLGFRYLTQIKKMKLNIILPVEAKHYLKNIYRQVIKDEGEEENLINFKDILTSIEKQRNTHCSWEDASPYPDICEKVHNMYQKEKTEQSLVDFNDILFIFSEQLKIDPMFSNKFTWIFVDESQDNNMKQIEIANLLANKNSVFIGDSKQSIYGFRGAAPHLFKEMSKIADRVYPLAYNYRSSPQIINFANILLKQMSQFKGQELIATKNNSTKPIFTLCDNAAFQTFRAIKEDIRRGVPLEEIAVLSRSVKPVTIQSLQVLLRKEGIPYTVRGGDDKLNAPFIQDYLSVLKSIVKPTKVSLVNAMGILPAVGPKTAMKLAESVIQNGKNFDILYDIRAKYGQTRAFKEYLFLDSVKEDNKELVLKALDFLHDHYLVPRYSKKDSSEPSNKKNIIFDVLYDYLLGFRTVSEGIDSLYINEEDVDADKGKLVISTIHQCVTKETIVETSQGLLEIGNIPEIGDIATPFGSQPYQGKFKKDKDTILRIKTKKGYSLNASPEHGVSVWDGHAFVRKRSDEIKTNDVIRIKLGETIQVLTHPSLHNISADDVREVTYPTPDTLTEDLGELLGILVGDGTLYHSGLRISKDQIEVIDRAEELLIALFDCSVKRGFLNVNEKTPFLEVNSTFLSRWFLGFEELRSNNKDIPKAILQSPLLVQKRFIRGLFEDGTVGVRNGDAYIDFRNYKPHIIRKLQVMLLRMGIVSTIVLDKKYKGFSISMLYIFGYFAEKFKKEIGLISKSKLAKLEDGNFGKASQYTIPFSRAESEIFRGNFETTFDWQNIRSRGYIGRDKIKKLYEKTRHPLLLEKLSWHYERVAEINVDFEETFCVEVPKGNRFLQNGIDGWNSKGLEWDSVHIMGMNEYGIPFLKPEDELDSNRLEEEFCLAYVACTRARKFLNMYMQFMNGQHDWAKPNKLSRYIKEIFRETKEEYLTFRILDVADEHHYKQRLYLKLKQQ